MIPTEGGPRPEEWSRRFGGLLEGCEGIGGEARRELLLQFELLLRFSGSMALTSDRSPEAAIRHVREASWCAEWLVGPRVLDVGAGAGLPMVSVAILRPDLRVTLCERMGKKVGFLDYLVARLGLERCEVRRAAVEELAEGSERWDSVFVRALPGLDRALGACEAVVAERGELVLLGGADSREKWVERLGAWRTEWREDPWGRGRGALRGSREGAQS